MLLSEAFKIAFHISDSSTEDLKLAQATIEFASAEALISTINTINRLAVEAFSEEIAERRQRLRNSLALAKRLAKKMS